MDSSATAAAAAAAGDSLSPAKPYRSSFRYHCIGWRQGDGRSGIGGGGGGVGGDAFMGGDVDREVDGLHTVQQIYRFGFAILHLVYVR